MLDPVTILHTDTVGFSQNICAAYIKSLPFICPLHIVILGCGNFFLSTWGCIHSVVVFIKYYLSHMLC